MYKQTASCSEAVPGAPLIGGPRMMRRSSSQKLTRRHLHITSSCMALCGGPAASPCTAVLATPPRTGESRALLT